MPCDRVPVRQVESALSKLKRYLADRRATVTIDRATGALAFAGDRTWNATADGRTVADVCAYRALQVSGSMELRLAIMDAERLAGRQVNPQAIAAGVHSHDGGASYTGGNQ